MSREWYHYPLGLKEDWPEGALPSADSVFRADFLNQFISWANYLNALGGLISKRVYYGPRIGWITFEGAHILHKIIQHQTIVQAASFLRKFVCTPGGRWLNWTIGQTDQPNYEYHPLYLQGSSPPLIQVGQDVHPRNSNGWIRQYFLTCRERLDSMIACRADTAWATGNVINCSWTEQPDGSSVGGCTTEPGNSRMLYIRSRGPWTNPSGNVCEHAAFMDYTVPAQSLPCSAAVYVINVRGDLEEPQLPGCPFPCPEPPTTASIIAECREDGTNEIKQVPSGGWLAIEGAYGHISEPIYPPGKNWGYKPNDYPFIWGTSSSMVCTALYPWDTIPAQFRL